MQKIYLSIQKRQQDDDFGEHPRTTYEITPFLKEQDEITYREITISLAAKEGMDIEDDFETEIVEVGESFQIYTNDLYC